MMDSSGQAMDDAEFLSCEPTRAGTGAGHSGGGHDAEAESSAGSPPRKRWRRPRRVDWYSPTQLLRTAALTVVSTVLGRQLDARRLRARGDPDDSVFDCSQLDEIGFDWAADTGDGWNGTFTLAWLLSTRELQVAREHDSDETVRLARGDFAILGGDEVYPVASKRAYAERLVWPFNAAARALEAGPPTPMLLIPGNHDWYDSLAAFTRRFLNFRRIGAFCTKQQRSYFAIRLPHRWHLWALDVQLRHDLDVDQARFFGERIDELGDGDRVIVCTAEPRVTSGVDKAWFEDTDELSFTLCSLQRRVEAKGATVRVLLAGDVHNYQRYELHGGDASPAGGRHAQTHIVSGGGGAFLHPTHGFPPSSYGRVAADRCLRPARLYPDARTSSRATFANLLFCVRHWEMALFIGLLYVVSLWRTDVPALADLDAGSALGALLDTPLDHPLPAAFWLLVWGGLAAFADATGWRKAAAGLVHAAAHAVAATIACALGSTAVSGMEGTAAAWLAHLVGVAAGFVLGGTVFGLYLLAALNVFRMHHNEAFSSLGIERFKHFLRCRIDHAGTLEIDVVGFADVAGDAADQPVRTHLVERLAIPAAAVDPDAERPQRADQPDAS